MIDHAVSPTDVSTGSWNKRPMTHRQPKENNNCFLRPMHYPVHPLLGLSAHLVTHGCPATRAISPI